MTECPTDSSFNTKDIYYFNKQPQSGLLQGWSCNSGLALGSVSDGHKTFAGAHEMSQSREERGGAEPSPRTPLYGGKGKFPRSHTSLFRTLSRAHMPAPAGDELITITMIDSYQSGLIPWGLGGGFHLTQGAISAQCPGVLIPLQGRSEQGMGFVVSRAVGGPVLGSSQYIEQP